MDKPIKFVPDRFIITDDGLIDWTKGEYIFEENINPNKWWRIPTRKLDWHPAIKDIKVIDNGKV